MSSIAAFEDQQRSLLAEVAEVDALEAQVFARKMTLRARVDELWNPDVPCPTEQFGVLELAGTARIGQARASSQLLNGTRLVQDLPGTLAALQDGRMFRESAVLLLELTRNCTSDVVRELERRLLPLIIDANTTDVRRLVLKLIPEVEADLDPELTEQRLAQAKARRSVWLADRGEGMVAATGEMDAISAKRWALDFEELVRAQKIADDKAGIVRTADQRRADVFAQLPSRMLALLHAIRNGQTEQLLALALADPDLADQLEAMAATLPDDTLLLDAVEPPVADQPLDEVEPMAEAEPWLPERDGCSAILPVDELTDDPADERADDMPLPPEHAPDEAFEPDPPDPALVQHWTDLSLLELAATVMGLPIKNPVVLNVHTPMSTLLALDNRTGQIDQGGALPASQVRLLMPDATLRRVFVDPSSGTPIGIDPQLHPPAPPAPPARPAPSGWQGDPRLGKLLDPFELTQQAEPRHDPSRLLRELIELRDQTCTGIGCSQPARQCHLDHETAYPAGPTAAWNLSAKSARCHRAKHAGWNVTRHGPGPQHGQVTWTSPLGHSYTRLSTWLHPRAPAPAAALGPTRTTFLPRDDIVIEIDAPTHGFAA